MIKRHILLVDDDEQTLTLVRFMLEQTGYIVKCVNDGFAAIDIMERFAFDLIILDINMPFASGFDVAKTIPRIEGAQKTPILFMSCRDDESSIKKSIEAGGKDYIVKPPERDVLLNKVQRIIGSRPQYYEVQMNAGEAGSAATLSYKSNLLSISESGMVVQMPVPLQIGQIISNLEVNLFQDLKIQKSKLQVCDCSEQDGQYMVYLSFLEMSDPDIQKIREWVIETCLKGRRSAA